MPHSLSQVQCFVFTLKGPKFYSGHCFNFIGKRKIYPKYQLSLSFPHCFIIFSYSDISL